MGQTLERAFGERIKHLSKTRLDAVICDKFLWKQIRFLTGKTFLPSPDEYTRVVTAMALIHDILEAERNKAKAKSHLYDGNRHIALNQVLNGLQTLKEKTTPLRESGMAAKSILPSSKITFS